MTLDPFEREEFMRVARYSRLESPRQYRTHCPRCLKGVNPSMLRRPHWREDGPRICRDCQNWEQKWSVIDRERFEHREHARGIKK